MQDQAPKPRPVKPLELAGYFAAATTISGLGLLALPFVITALGVAAPVWVVGFFLHRLWKANR
jgi:hypothetical protein